MPRQQVRAVGHDRSRSLGWLALAWMEFFVVHGPGDVQGEPVVHGDEYSELIADCYALSPPLRMLYDSVFWSRPKGCDKSGMGARFGLFEGLGPCRPAGIALGGEVYEDPWGLGFRYTYEPGEPMGRPVRVPFIRCMATEENQVGNVYDSIYYNLTEGPLASVMRRDDAGLTRILLPGGGEITPSTASSAAKDGGKETFVVFDESHLYNRPELRRMYATVARNLRKRKKIAQTWYLETTTMFAPGEDSVAEETYKLAELIREKRTKRERLLLDHRWGECEDLSDEKALREAVIDAYGDAMAWNDLDGIVDQVLDIRAAQSDSRRYFLNAPTSAADAWVAEHEWAARLADPFKVVADADLITLGFDGSRSRARGMSDATALVGCRVSDGHVFELRVWEQPSGVAGRDWQVPEIEVDAEVAQAFSRYNVVGFYADPAKWESTVARWEASYGGKLRQKATRDHPIQWWMVGARARNVVPALKSLNDAILDGAMTHDGSSALTRHVLNARRRPSRSGIQIHKEHPDSERKIDAAVAATLAWQARMDALAAGVMEHSEAESYAPFRIW